MILSLGNIKFETSTTIETVKTSHKGNYTTASRLYNTPAYFANMLPTKSITLDGIALINSEIDIISELQSLLNSQISKPLATGYGDYLGEFVITELSYDKSLFTADGYALKTTFNITMEQVNE